MITDRDRDVFILAITSDCEAADQGDDGLVAVMWSIQNRHRAKKWYSGKTVASTCVMPFAFSSWNTSDKNRVRVLSTGVSDPVLYKALQLADQVMSELIPDPTNGATHYYSTKIMAEAPDWVSGVDHATGVTKAPPAEFTVQIRDHRFYKGVA